MTFKKGFSGNPEGRPRGAPNKRTQLAKLLEPHAEELIAKAIELALQGDSTALRLCIERLLPRIKSEAIEVDLPEMDLKQPSGLIDVGSEILRAVMQQKITPEQAKSLSEVVEIQRKNIETHELQARVQEIERTLKIRNKGVRK